MDFDRKELEKKIDGKIFILGVGGIIAKLLAPSLVNTIWGMILLYIFWYWIKDKNYEASYFIKWLITAVVIAFIQPLVVFVGLLKLNEQGLISSRVLEVSPILVITMFLVIVPLELAWSYQSFKKKSYLNLEEYYSKKEKKD